MLKKIKDLFNENTLEISFPTSLFIENEVGTLEDFVQQMYCTKKFEKWLNFFPFVWVTFDKDYFDVGCTGTFKFLFPPFTYKMTCVEIDRHKRHKAVFSGLMKGEATSYYIQKEDGVLLEHPVKISGKNKLVHLYYWLFLRPPHLAFMAWRFNILKKNLVNEKLNKENHRHEA